MKTSLIIGIISSSLFIASCTKDACDSPGVSDQTVGSMITSSSMDIIQSITTNDNAQWKIKMNDVAARVYAEDLQNYPANSMIVKERHNTSGEIDGYDVMFRSPGDVNSVNGWLWSQFSSDGKVIYSSTQKGNKCQSCHATMSKTVH